MAHLERIIFASFIPPARVEDAHGAWRRCYEHRKCMTGDRIGLLPESLDNVSPATVVDEQHKSPFMIPELEQILKTCGVTTLIISRAETKVARRLLCSMRSTGIFG